MQDIKKVMRVIKRQVMHYDILLLSFLVFNFTRISPYILYLGVLTHIYS